MRLLHPDSGGKHFAEAFAASAAPAGLGPDDLCRSLKSGTRLREGTADFEQYRACVLRDADRSVYAASSLFLRALRLFTKSSSPWLHVTLYYSSFLAAKSITSSLGAWDAGSRTVACEIEDPGRQKFLVRKRKNGKGSHKDFWYEFYASVTTLKSWADASRVVALDPVNGDPEWLILQRNAYNYKMVQWWHHMDQFETHFDEARFPSSLPKELAQQFEVAKEMLCFAHDVFSAVGLKTDVFLTLDRLASIRMEIFKSTLANLDAYEEAFATDLFGTT